ncbi:MAG TPA: TonB-dependent receptor [Rhodobacteraceae bacterium]|nr:TonB-dependent receptor [Paracoccaceae bacterium]
MQSRLMRIMLNSAAAMAILAPAGGALGQTAQDSGQALHEETITVTTRKREESIQDVPIAIEAFTAEDLYQAGITDTDELAFHTTGFTMAPLFGGDAATPVIRGLSTTIGEPNVGFFVDGVYQSSRLAMEALLGAQIARIEVAKGPQSALYGRNTFAGAINYVTKEPANTYEATLEATGGSDGIYDLRASASGPLVQDKLFFQLGLVANGRDGFYKNQLTGKDLDKRETEVYAGGLTLTPNDRAKITFRVSYEDTSDGDDPLAFIPNNADFFSVSRLPPANQVFEGELPAPTSFAVTPGGKDRQNLSMSLNASYDLDNGYTLTSVTGFNDLDFLRRVDNDYEARQIAFLTNQVNQQELSQEFRITSPGTDRVRWMAGTYYYHFYGTTRNDDRRVGTLTVLPTILPPPVLASLAGIAGGLNSTTKENTDSIAVFGNVQADVTDRFNISISGRWTSERKSVAVLDIVQLTGAPGFFAGKRRFKNFQPKLTLTWHPADNWMLYASAAKGEKTGGFNVITTSGLVAPDERTYNPEKAYNYELGTKGAWLDGALQIDADVFYIDWKNQIVRALGKNFATLNANAGKTTSKGFELDMTAHLSDRITFEGGLAYTDSAYDKYTFGTLAAVGLNPVLDGTRLQYVSKWSGNAALSFVQPLANGNVDWHTRLEVAYQSNQSAVQPALAYTGARTLGNIRSGFSWDRYDITFWGKNLFKDKSAANGVFLPNPARRSDAVLGLVGIQPVAGFEAFGALSLAPDPRTWGVTARAQF